MKQIVREVTNPATEISLEEAQQLDRERHDKGGVLLGGHLHDRLEQAELQAARVVRQRAAGLSRDADLRQGRNSPPIRARNAPLTN